MALSNQIELALSLKHSENFCQAYIAFFLLSVILQKQK